MKNNSEPRPLQHLREIAARYPDAWQHVAKFRAERGKTLPDWPEWCYLPLAAVYAIVSGGGSNRVSQEQGVDIGRLAALAAWRATKGIYRFDATTLDALWATPLEGHLPDELLERLPEWCVYVETPNKTWQGGTLHGFYAHLESDAKDGRRELRLVLDLERAGLLPVPLHLTGGNLTQAVERVWTEANRQGAQIEPEEILSGAGKMARSFAPLVSTLLYLCSEEPDLANSKGTPGKPANPAPQKTRQGVKEFPADSITGWNVGWRIGAALRTAESAQRAASGGGEHASPRAHLRRAHWHTYLTGPGRNTRILRWLSPILVNYVAEELPAVIHPIENL